MESQTDYSMDINNLLLIRSVDPIFYQAFNPIDDSFARVDDTEPTLSVKPYLENNSTTPNDLTSSGTSVITNENQLTAEEANWDIPLPMILDLHSLFSDTIIDDIINTPILSTDELQISSRPTQPPCVMDTSIIADNEIDPPQIPPILSTDELQISSRPTQPPCVMDTSIIADNEIDPLQIPPILSTDELQISSRPTQLPCVMDISIIADNEIDPPQIPPILSTDELQISSRPTQPPCVMDTSIIADNEIDPLQIPPILSTDELQISSRPTQLPCVMDTSIIADNEIDPPQIPTTYEVQQEMRPAEQHPSMELLLEPPQFKGRRLKMPHKYNTRMTAYKKNLSEFIVQEQELLNRLKKNQQRPTPQNALTPHNQWIHSKDWVNINLLKIDIPIRKQPNYSETKRYKARKARSKNPSVTSTTSLGAECSNTTSTMEDVKDISNQQ